MAKSLFKNFSGSVEELWGAEHTGAARVSHLDYINAFALDVFSSHIPRIWRNIANREAKIGDLFESVSFFYDFACFSEPIYVARGRCRSTVFHKILLFLVTPIPVKCFGSQWLPRTKAVIRNLVSHEDSCAWDTNAHKVHWSVISFSLCAPVVR